MTSLNTSRSRRMAEAFLARNQPYRRKTLVLKQTLSAPPDMVFSQLCPTRETDWIEAWTADLIWTTTGYAEPGCIFTTPEPEGATPSVWIFTRHAPDDGVELVKVTGDRLLTQLRILLTDLGDGTCDSTWTYTITALNDAGNAMVDAMPEDNPHLRAVVAGLEYFLTTGERPSRAAAAA